VTIIENGVKILWDINTNLLWDKKISNSKNYKYFQENTELKGNKYTIVIQAENEYSHHTFFIQYSYFLLFTLPFTLLFYGLWYIFVWKNFLPIRETISSLETFSGNMNHEMKTPLAEIISTLSLAQKVKWNYETAIETSLNSSRKLSKILDSLLWIINLVDSSYKKQKLNLVDELESIIKDNKKRAQKRNIIIKKDFSEKNYSLTTNKEHFHICIWNILRNAIKYSNKNWHIDIKFNNWKIQIQDYWIGIEAKNLKNIFNRYFRENYVKQEWYWLWLALVKKITDIHSWKIDIESKKDIGTKVSIRFI
jgi:two-component system phosphate regulon sensor histidine kinase PhoR